MVRKRSRTSRKHYESDDNDSDSDFSLEDPHSQPAPKKYSLRQRKKALFIDDYDYEDDDEILPIPPTKAHSDDEDFDLESEVNVPNSEYEVDSAYTSTNNYEDPSEDPNGLIDFEDMIRADIVVNKNRIDYDNMINKTEITIQPNNPQTTPVKSKRGRKPKKRPESEMNNQALEPQTEVQENSLDKTDTDYIPNEEVQEKVQNSIQNLEDIPAKDDICSSNKEMLDETKDGELNDQGIQQSNPSTQELTLQNDKLKGDSEQLNVDSQESVIKFNQNSLSKSIHVNGTVLTTETELCESKDSIQNCIVSDDDDDVVFVEDKRSEVIVLDD